MAVGFPRYEGPMPAYDAALDRACLEEQALILIANREYGITVPAGKENVVSYGMALYKGNLRRIIDYINNGADPHLGRDLPLHVAASKGHLAFFRFLHQERGADLNSVDGCALRMAAFFGHRDIVEYLIDNRAIVGINDAIRQARQRGFENIALLLTGARDA